MGTTYTVGLGVGYVLGIEEVMAPFLFETPEESHMEERFDPMTGAKIDPIKVVTKSGSKAYIISGEEFNSYHEAIEELSRELGYGFAWIGGLNEKDSQVLFHVNNPYDGETYGTGYSLTVYAGRFPVGTDWTEPLKELKDKLTYLGVEVGEAVVQIFCNYG